MHKNYGGENTLNSLTLPQQLKITFKWANQIPKKIKTEEYLYVVLKVVPYKTSYSAKEFEKIMNTISKYYTPFLKRFEIKNRTLIYHPPQPFCYEVLFTKEKVTYSFVIPSIYKTLFENKIRFLLKNCDIIEIPDYMEEFKDGIKQTITYSKNWMFAINTNDNINLNDNFLVLTKDLQTENDKILMQYLFQPIPDWDWKNKWQSKYESYAKNGGLNSINNLTDLLDYIINFVLNQLDLFLNGLMMAVCGEQPVDQKEDKINFTKDLSTETKHKSIYDGFKTNINVFYKVENPITLDNISRNIQTIMQDIKGDNELKCGKIKVIKQYKDIKRVVKKGFIINTEESKQMIKTPSEKMMKEYDYLLERINVTGIDIPAELLQEGNGILLGDLQKGNKFVPIYFGTHANSISKPLVYISPQEGGKSSFLRMYGVDAVGNQGHSIFAFDTIDGKTIQIIRDYLPEDFPEEKIVILDFRNNKYVFPLVWNELFDDFQEQLQEAKDDIDRYSIMENFGDIIGSELIRFIDTFQSEDRQNRLTPNMRSYLTDLAQLVFMNNGNFGMIKDCLYDIRLRHKLLKQLNIPGHLPFTQSIFRIDEEGENSSTLRGIETRLNLIMENATLKKYFSVKTDKKLDFAYWANNGYCVLIQIPETFADPLITFLVQKLWLAVKTSRRKIKEDERPHTHLLIDEPNRFPTIMNLLTDQLIASRKWHLRFLFFIHNINIFRGAGENLKNAGTSFIILPTSQYNFSQVAEFYNPMTFDVMKEVEKLMSKYNGTRRFALASIHYKNVWYPCVIRLPLPIEMRNKYINRSHLNELCSKRYGVSQREYYKSLFKV